MMGSTNALRRVVLARPFGRLAQVLRGLDFSSSWFPALIAFYVALQYFLPGDTARVSQFSPLYFALILPAWAVVLFHYRKLFLSMRGIEAPVWIFLFGAVAVSMIRLDFTVAYNAILFALIIITVIRTRACLSPAFLNGLFMAAVVGSIVSYTLGLNNFGFLPGQSTKYEFVGLEWRISLFPLIPESAYLALFVLSMNLFIGKGRWRWVVIPAAGYFLMFSGLRSAIIAAMFVMGLWLLRFVLPGKQRALLWILWIGAIGLFFLVSMSDMLARLIPDLGIDVLNRFLYRSNTGVVMANELPSVVHRGMVWKAHTEAFLGSLPWGCGGEVVRTMAGNDCDAILKAASNLCLPCSAFTGWLATLGIVALPLLAFVVYTLPKKAIDDRNLFLLATCFTQFVIAMSWGPLFAPYNFIFLLHLSALNMGQGTLVASEAPARKLPATWMSKLASGTVVACLAVSIIEGLSSKALQGLKRNDPKIVGFLVTLGLRESNRQSYSLLDPVVLTQNYEEYVEDRDPLLGWPVRWLTEEHDTDGSRLGRRNFSASDPACVSQFGDSFTWSAGVSRFYSWSSYLSDALGCRVANYGVTDYGTDQAYLRFTSMQPSGGIAMLNHHVGDILANINQMRNLLHPGPGYAFKPRFIVVDGELELVPLPKIDKQQLATFFSDTGRFLKHEWFLQQRAEPGETAASFPSSIALVRAIMQRDRVVTSGYAGTHEEFYSPTHPSGAIEVTKKIIEQFVADARQRGQIPVVSIIPTPGEIALYKRSGAASYSALVADLRAKGYKILDFTPEMLARLDTANPEELYRTVGGHLTRQGNRLLAEITAEFLRRDAETAQYLDASRTASKSR